MSIDTIGSAPLGGLYGANEPYNAPLSASTAANSAETTASGGLSSTSGFLQALSLTLQQSGLDTPPVIAPPSAAGNGSETGNNPPSNGADPSNANPVQSFVLALAQALSPSAVGGPGSAGATPYTDASLENRLRGLVSALGSDSTHTSPSLQQLMSAFRHLAQQSNNASSQVTAGDTSGLERFLQTLTQNLALDPRTAGQPLSHIGSLIGSTSA